MKKLIGRMALLMCLLLAGCTALIVVLPRNPHSYLAANAAKRRLLGEAVSPRIIFIGGSSLAFGLDSDLLSSKAGMDVVNMGLHADLGLDFMMSQVTRHVRPGDVIILTPEYSHYWRGFRGGPGLCKLLIEDPKAVRNLTHYPLPALLRYGGTELGERLVAVVINKVTTGSAFPAKDPVYHAGAFNRRGDVVSHLGLPRPDRHDGPVFRTDEPRTLHQGMRRRIEAFVAHCDRCDAHVYFVPPAVRLEDYAATPTAFDSLYAEVTAAFPGRAFGAPRVFAYPEATHFFDSRYHLNAKGRGQRTRQIAALLRPLLDGGPTTSAPAP